jgi:hypothetical protein
MLNSLWGKALLLAGVVLFVVAESQGRNDWNIFLSASVDLFLGKNIYTEIYFGSYHYYYSVLFATLLWPLAQLPGAINKALWLCLNIFLLWRVAQLVFYYLSDYMGSRSLKYVFGLLLFLVSIRLVRGNLHLGQMTILMLCLSLESIYRIQKGQWRSGALALSIAINIKIFPIVLLPYLLYRAKWKALVLTLVLMSVWYLLPSLWLGWEHCVFLLEQWWLLINPTNMRHIKDVEETSFHSLSTLLSTLLTDYVNPEEGLQTTHNIANLSEQQLVRCIQFTRLFFVFFTLYFLRSFPFVAMGQKLKVWWELSYILLIIPLIFPHQQHYAFLMAVPALAYMLCWLMNVFSGSTKPNTMDTIMLVLFIMVAITINLSLIVPACTAWLNHYKILTYAALLLVVLLAMAQPKYMLQNKNSDRL